MSSSTDHPWIYDVFINFRGKDVRDTFVSRLHDALSNAGIRSFLDNKNLTKGKKLGPELKRAIEGSQICIVVLSLNYTESSWCLNELLHIMECSRSYGQIVLPVFYGVDPSSVRKQNGSFGDSFLKITQSYSVDLVDKWRNALYQVGNLSGWTTGSVSEHSGMVGFNWVRLPSSDETITFSGGEDKLVKNIVEDIWKKIDISLSITEFPIGLESRVQKVMKFINDQSSKACMIGIWGMGGSGKTTLAKAIYNQIHGKFEGRRSFIECIREAFENDSRGIVPLQQQLLSEILKTKNEIHSIASGITKIETKLRGQKAFIVLDDVTKSNQLKAFGGNPKLFVPGSVLIVTTRDLHLLNSLNVDHVFKMTEMDNNQSLELFSWHAFRQPSPKKDFSKLSESVVDYCGGLPLALEVLGSYLSKRTEQEWRSALSKLVKIPNNQVQQILRISYDDLEDYMEKDIFLDICCFFIGKNRADVTQILNGCGLHADIGIAVLIERSLIKVEKNNKLQVHDLIRDMGRAIVAESLPKDPAKHSRLWFHEDVLNALSNNTGTETVKGLVLKSDRTDGIRVSTNAFQEMKKLRLLKLHGVDVIGDYGLISKQLRWVDWQRSTFKFIPNDFDHGNVVVFELKYSSVEQVWQETKLLEKLKVLNLSHCKNLKRTPDFSKLPNLEKLIMKDCQSLSEIHWSIGDLKNLLLINLRDCTNLGYLPKEIYHLTSVTTLIFSGCSKIDKLEEDIGKMESLKTLIAANTGVKQVPFSVVRLKSIGYISLCGYEGLSRDIFPSIIWSWMSPTMNSLPHIPLFGGLSMSLVSLDIGSKYLGLAHQSPILSSSSKLRSVCVQCHSEIQLKDELRRCLYDLPELETSQSSDLPFKSILIGMGSCQIVNETLGNSLSQGLSTNKSSASFLPRNNLPAWLAYTSEGPSVCFQVPKDSDRGLTGITLCVESMAPECLTSVLIINYTKLTIQIYKRDTIMSFNDQDWKGVVSKLGVGEDIEIFVAFGHGLTVKETTVYLIYGDSTVMDIEPSIVVEVEPMPNVKTESSLPSPGVEAQLLPDVKMEPPLTVKNEPLPKPNEKLFRRLVKRVGRYLCLNHN